MPGPATVTPPYGVTRKVTGGGMGAWAAGVAMTLFIVLGVASGAHHVIEAPAQRWLRQRLSTPRADTIGPRPGKA